MKPSARMPVKRQLLPNGTALRKLDQDVLVAFVLSL